VPQGKLWGLKLPHKTKWLNRMSSPPNGRALALPLVWSRDRAPVVPLPETSPVPSPRDEELIADLQAQDARALDILFDRYARLVFGIASRIVRDYSEAEEVVQETFFYVYQRAALFDPEKGGAKAWIVQIAFSRALDRKAHLSRRGFYNGTEIESLADTLVGKADVEREIGAKLDFAQLQKAFEDLTPMQRRTLELFYFEGFELNEISQRLQEPFGNVRHHFYRGLERLRKSPSVQRLRGNGR
jgi:RNA polymerase sigma-70 factor, ECF subfamily